MTRPDDLISERHEGRRRFLALVGSYFTNYEAVLDWHLVPAWLDGREVLAVYTTPADPRPRYFVELTLVDGRVTRIRDLRYVPYPAAEAPIEVAPPA